MLNHLKIGTRLALGLGTVIVASVAAFSAAVLMARSSLGEMTEQASAMRQRADTVHGMLESQMALVSAIRNAGLQTDGGAVNQEVAAYNQALTTLKRLETEFAAQPLGDEERAILQRAKGLREQAEPVAKQAVEYTMAFAGEEAAKLLTGKFAPLQAQWAAELKRLGDLQAQQALARGQALAEANDRRMLLLGIGLAVMAAAAAGFATLLTRSVTRPLQQAVQCAEQVAQGDLNIRLNTQGSDEAAQLLRALQSMAQQLSAMVQAVHESSSTIHLASNEISGGNLDLSGRTERTAAELQETAATLESLSESVAGNAGRAHQAQSVVERTGQIAETGGQAMHEVVSTMQGISESSRRIGDIIGVIDGIAFQTNILALNAAVEAARAGEQGRGFAVVATEVRALAQRVTAAASEVRGLIGESVQRVDTGARLVNQMGGTMGELVDGVGQVRSLIGEISAASSQQNERIQQVNHSVRALDNSTQQNAALVEQVSAAAHSLAGQTERLNGLIRRFRTGA